MDSMQPQFLEKSVVLITVYKIQSLLRNTAGVGTLSVCGYGWVPSKHLKNLCILTGWNHPPQAYASVWVLLLTQRSQSGGRTEKEASVFVIWGPFWANGMRDMKIPSLVEKYLECSMKANVSIVYHSLPLFLSCIPEVSATDTADIGKVCFWHPTTSISSLYFSTLEHCILVIMLNTPVPLFLAFCRAYCFLKTKLFVTSIMSSFSFK